MSAQQNQERVAAIAFILDRARQFEPGNSNHDFAGYLVAGLAEGRHVECANAGEYYDLRRQVKQIMKSREGVTPLVRRPKQRSAR